MKVEFPIDVKTDPDESHWGAACAKLSGICPVPWILLSASVDIDTYIRQVTVACLQGASGIAAGRAVWMEAPGLKEPARTHFLERVARPRMARLTDLVSALGRPWTTFFTPPAPGEDWCPKPQPVLLPASWPGS